jgi:PDZ domain-containing protein
MDMYRKSDIFGEDQDRAEFAEEQTYRMLGSQSAAIMAAYDYLEIPYQVEPVGVVVIATQAGMPAEDVLKPGDWIVRVDGKAVTSFDELSAGARGKQIGDPIQYVIRREGHERNVELVFADYSKVQPSLQQPTPGLGFSMSEIQDVVPEEKKNKVEIKAGSIGGPSAGLMFALEIVDQFHTEDLTRGAIIAGTGEIAADGEVGPIGGIRHKVVAADREGARYFFSPLGNQTEAEEKVQSLHTEMRVIPVATLADAVEFLRQLPSDPSPSEREIESNP